MEWNGTDRNENAIREEGDEKMGIGAPNGLATEYDV